MDSGYLRRFATLFLVLAVVVVGRAQTRTLQVVVHGKSVQLLPSNAVQTPGVGNVTTYFSTYNGSSGFLIDSPASTVSGELRPRTGSSGIYEGGYGQATPVAFLDYGSYAVSIPSTDTDGNGIPDLLQYERAGSFTASGSGYSVEADLPFSISVQFLRAAGLANGTYIATTQSSTGQSSSVSGGYSLLSYQGTVSYQRAATNTLNVAITGLFQNGMALTGSTTYTSGGADQLSYAGFTLRDAAGATYAVKAGTMTRSGNSYRGDLSLVDGMAQTYWADFVNYVIQFTDENDSDGDGVPDLTDPNAGQPPSISTQPRTQTVSVNQSVTFSVVATNATTYQWMKNGAALSGATSSSITMTRLQMADGGNYVVHVSNGSGTTVSSPAVLTVNPSPVGPTVTVSPLSLTVARGSSFILTVAATGFPAPNYTWRRGGQAISGATNSTLLVTNAGTANSGTYSVLATNSMGSAVSASATITLSDSNDAGRLTNLSVRTRAGTGAETLIAGFNVGGAGTVGSKSLLIRGVGPSLAQFSVPNAVQDPSLTVYAGKVVHSVNDNWGGSAQLRSVAGQVGAFSLVSDSSQDAAIYAPGLSSGSYTAHTTSSGAPGIALVEVYDATAGGTNPNATPRLTNVSTRAQVETGSGILIAGFYVNGTTARTLLIRGVGPTLSAFGVEGVLADPQLAVYSGSRVVATNDDWGNNTTIARTTEGVGGFALPATSKDSAVLITLQPGSYTAQVSGVTSTTGVGLIEIYEVTTIVP